MPFSECGEQAVGVGREQGDQGGGCMMVQEEEDRGGAGVGSGVWFWQYFLVSNSLF